MAAKKKPAKATLKTRKTGTRLLKNRPGGARLQPQKRKPAYTPPTQQDEQQPRRCRAPVHMTGDRLSGLSPKQTFAHLVSTGHLPKLQKNSPCPFCSTPLKATCDLPLPEVLQGTGAPHFRCNSKECNARVHPLSGSPVFVCGRGKDTLPLNTQAKVLFLAAWGAQLRQARAQTGLSEKSLSKAHARWRLVLRKWVEYKQGTISHGGAYEEGEADEAVFRKKDVTTGLIRAWWSGTSMSA